MYLIQRHRDMSFWMLQFIYTFTFFLTLSPFFIVLSFITTYLILPNNRRTGWANLNTSVPNLEEVSSSEFPEDAVKRIAKVNEIFTKLNTTALAPLPSMSLIPGMGETNRIDLLKGVDEPPTTSSSTAAISTAAENAINAALGISAAADNLDSELVPANTPSEALVVDDPMKSRVNYQTTFW